MNIINYLPAFLHSALSFFIVLSVIVFVHEFGHYIVARWCGVKINVFSIGFGRELFGWTDKTGTRWKIAALPLGGYVKMFGDSSAASTPDKNLDQMGEAEKKISFHHKRLWQKALIVAAGPFANFLLTIIVLTYFVLYVGVPTTEPIVGEVLPNTPAQEAGLQPGDRITSVDGTAVETFGDIPRLIITNLGTPVALSLERSGKPITLTITPRPYEDEDGLGNKVTRPLIGFKSLQMTYRDVGLPAAVWEATKRTWLICETSLEAVGQIITGKRGAEDLKGPLGIAKLSGQATDRGLDTILWFIAMLSANLGLVNLFPVPLLDGGHLMYYGVEALRGRPMAQRLQEYGFRLGFAMLAMLMGFTIYNDIRQLF